jgi:signal peptidase I
MAESKNDDQAEKSKKGTWTEGIGSFGLAIGVALFIRWLLLEAYVIPSGSMLPTLLIHDHIFVNKIVYGVRIPFSKKWLLNFSNPEKGDVVVFRYPEDEGTFYIKRVIGTPGDKVFYDNGELYINDKQIEKKPPRSQWPIDLVRDKELPPAKSEYTYFEEALTDDPHTTLLRNGYPHMDYGPKTVPEGMLFVMGDNRDNSNDSRYWGYVPLENVLGRAMFVWLSCEETIPNVPFICNPLTIRGSRFFHSIK